eukprot:g5529.t1
MTMEWFYRDDFGKTRGPFSQRKMQRWFKNGQLPGRLGVSSSKNGPFKLLETFGADGPFVSKVPPPLPARNSMRRDHKKGSSLNRTYSSTKDVQQKVVVEKSSSKWWYRDFAKKVHGPFSDERMQKWDKRGYFTGNLEVRRGKSGEFVLLSEMRRKCGPEKSPFVSSKSAELSTVISTSKFGVKRGKISKRQSQRIAIDIATRGPSRSSSFNSTGSDSGEKMHSFWRSVANTSKAIHKAKRPSSPDRKSAKRNTRSVTRKKTKTGSPRRLSSSDMKHERELNEKRKRVVSELLRVQEEFVASLTAILQHYVEPIELALKQSSKVIEKEGNEGEEENEEKGPCLTEEEHSKIFRNLRPLLTLMESLLESFRKRKPEDRASTELYRMAEAIKKIGPFLKLFFVYLQDLDEAQRIVTETLEREKVERPISKKEAARMASVNQAAIEMGYEGGVPDAHMSLSELQLLSMLKGNGALNSMLIKPVQALPRLKMMLERFVKYSRPDEVQVCKDALAAVEASAQHCNKSIAEKVAQEELYEAFNRLPGLVDCLPGKRKGSRSSSVLSLSVNRKLIKESWLWKRNRDGNFQKKVFVLLSDCLCYGKPGNAVLKPEIQHGIPLLDLEVSSTVASQKSSNDNDDDESFQYVFTIMSMQKSFVVAATSQEERDAWIEAISTQRDAVVESRRASKVRRRSLVVATERHSFAPLLSTESNCSVCGCEFSNYGIVAAFTSKKKRLHCFNCGVSVCASCSVHKWNLEGQGKKRVCNPCFEDLNRSASADFIAKSCAPLPPSPSKKPRRPRMNGKSLFVSGLGSPDIAGFEKTRG